MIKHKKNLVYFRWLLTCIIIVFVLRKLNIDSLYVLLVSVRPAYLLIGFSIPFLGRFAMVYRWSVLLQTQGYQLPKVKLFKIMVVSNAIGISIPSSSDGIRAYVLWKHTRNAVDSVTSVVIDRFAGLFSLTGIALFSGLISYHTLNNMKFIFISGTLFGLCILLTITLFCQNMGVINLCRRFKSSFRHKWCLKLIDILESLLQFRRYKRALIKVLGLSVIVHLLRILSIYYLALALSIQISFIDFAMFLPIIILLLMLPISIGGIGVREVTFLYFFGPLGMSVEEAVGLSFACYIIVIWWLVVGLIIYASGGVRAREAIPEKGAKCKP